MSYINAAKTYSTKPRKAHVYETLEPIIALTLTDFVMFDDIPSVIIVLEFPWVIF